jgi:hypothetical protein
MQSKSVVSWAGTQSASRSHILLPILSRANKLTTRVIASSPSPHPRRLLRYSLRSTTMGAGLPFLCQTRTSHSFSTGPPPRPFRHHSPPLASQVSHSNMRRSTASSWVIWHLRPRTQISWRFFVIQYSACAMIVNPSSSAHSRAARAQKSC